MASMIREKVRSSTSDNENGSEINEIQAYLDWRCITPHEAAWRLFQYEIHHSTPSIECLPLN